MKYISFLKLFQNPIVQFYELHIKPVYLRVFGILGMAGAPWILIDFIENGLYDRFKSTSVSGVHNLLFMTGCLCSVAGLHYIKAAGTTRTAQWVLIVQLVLLAIADSWCIYEIIWPNSNAPLYYWLGLFWPVGCTFLVVTGLFILRARRLKGWRARMPLLAGLWFPFMAIVFSILKEKVVELVLSGVYAAVVFMALGFSLVTLPDRQRNLKTRA